MTKVQGRGDTLLPPPPSQTHSTGCGKILGVNTSTWQWRGGGGGTVHGNADISLLEGGGVVHSVSGHSTHVALVHQDLHDGVLVLGEHLSKAVSVLYKLVDVLHSLQVDDALFGLHDKTLSKVQMGGGGG